MSLHHFVPPHPTLRGERVHSFGRSHSLALASSAAEHPSQNRPGASVDSLRLQHLRKVFDILHLCLLRGDGPRAARALRVLVRAKEWRHAELWRYGLAVASLLSRDPASNSVDESTSAPNAESSRQVQARQAAEAAATRRLAYLRGLYRVKTSLKPEVLVDIVFELIALKRYEEAMREIDYVLDTHPFRTYPALHLLAGMLTLDSGLHAVSSSTPLELVLSEVPSSIRRAAEHHFQQALTAASKNDAHIELAIQTRLATSERREKARQRKQLADLDKEIRRHQVRRAAAEDSFFGDPTHARVKRKPSRRKFDTEEKRERYLDRKALKYDGPHKWAHLLAKKGRMPESDVDDDEDRASQESAISDPEDAGPASQETRAGDDAMASVGSANGAEEDEDMDDVDTTL